jgi:hypothetical protein
MSSFGTEKKPTDNLNLGFPDPYAYWYAGTRRPEQYMPERSPAQLNIIAGDDLQAQYHQQKMRDAHYMAGAKVRATHIANARAFSSPNGYYNLPPPVLGQRQLANPSFGALSGSSARLDVPGIAPWSEVQSGANPYRSQFQRKPAIDWSYDGAGLCGGVLRTTVAQDWGRAKLNDRINQFNAIAEAKQAFFTTPEGGLGGVPTVAPQFNSALVGMNEQLGMLPQVELAQHLQSVLDAFNNPGRNYENISRFVVGDANKILALCIRLATSNSSDDIMNALEFMKGNSAKDGITQHIADLLETIEANGSANEPMEGVDLPVGILKSMKALFERIESYLLQMLKVADAPANERQAVSKNLIKSLGFVKFMKDDAQLYAQVGNANTQNLAYVNPDRSQRYPIQKSGAFIAPYGTEEIPEVRAVRRQGRNLNPLPPRNPYSSFSAVGQRREDTQHGYIGEGSASFDVDTRQAFGRNASAPPGYYPSAEGDQSRPGGRGIGYMDNAQAVMSTGMMMGNDGEDAQIALMAQQWREQPNASVPQGMRSVADPLVGHDIALGSPQPSVAPASQYTAQSSVGSINIRRADVPRDSDGLMSLIGFLNANVSGYNQRVYNKPETNWKNVRKNTLRNMERFGVLSD